MFSISDIIAQAWELTKKHGLILALFLLFVGVATAFLQLSFYPAAYWAAVFSGDSADMVAINNALPFFSLGNILAYLVGFIFQMGLLVTLLRLARGTGKNISFDSFALPFSTYLKYIGAAILCSIITLVGLFFLVLPGVYLSVRLSFVLIYIVDHPDASLDEAFKASWKMTEGQVLNLVGLYLVAGFVSLLGLVLCCVGVVFTVFIAEFSMVIAYLYLLDADRPEFADIPAAPSPAAEAPMAAPAAAPAPAVETAAPAEASSPAEDAPTAASDETPASSSPQA